mmetsp:Transcript_18342/g.31908  ORF Transcript_18342/g.31908 Transcript_18342/m.31908 type:complete len:251 (+) Transcript_18342:650-1402(+)
MRPKKRTKKSNEDGAKHSKAVTNLLRYDHFVKELAKRKHLCDMSFSDGQKQVMHQEVLNFVEAANQSATSLAVSAVWNHIQQFASDFGHDSSDDFLLLSPSPLPKARTKSGGISGGTVRGARKGNSNRPRNLHVQCSLDPCEWTMAGGTPTVLAQSNTPVSDMLNFMPPLSAFNPCVFSPTPRGGHSCPTPLNALPTPTGLDMKKLDVSAFEDSLFGDSLFLMEPLTLSGNPPVLSPILRQSHHTLLTSD